MDQIQNLLDERGKEYGDTHYLAGLVMGVLKAPLSAMIANAPELSHNWVLMLSKLIRILYNPYKVDSYDDLIGYAELSKRTINGKE